MDAVAAADRARPALSSAPFGDGLRVTASAGVAQLADPHDGAALYRRADEALYAGKAYGRDLTQLLAISDAFDAMTSERPYRAARSVDEAVAEIDRCAGRQFRPDAAVRIRRALGWLGCA